MCGYEIKRVVDHSTRFFWAASYGQIYPELRSLSRSRPDRGAADRDQGARSGSSTASRTSGREALRRWLGVRSPRPRAARRGPAEAVLRASAAPRAAAETLRGEARPPRARSPPSCGRSRPAARRAGELRPCRAALRDRVQRVGRPTGASATAAEPRDADRGAGRLMLDRLASLATGARGGSLIVAGVLFVARRRARRRRRRPPRPLRRRRPAAPRASSPTSRLEAAGYRETGVIVLARRRRPALGRGARAGQALADARSAPNPTSPRSPSFASTRSRRLRLARRRLDLPRRRAEADRRRRGPGRRRADRRLARPASPE